MSDIESRLAHVIRIQAGLGDDDPIGPDTLLADDLGLDSLDFVELIMMIEEEFDISIDDGEAEQVKTVADALRLIVEGGAE